MSETTVETVETVESAENVAETVENVETPESVESVESADDIVEPEPEISAEDKAKALLDTLDEDLSPMVIGARHILTKRLGEINSLVASVKSGTLDVEDQISDAIADSEDEDIVKTRENLAKMRQRIDEENAKLRAKIAEMNNLVVMGEDDVKAKTEEIDGLFTKFNSGKTATVKMLETNGFSTEDALAFFGDIPTPNTLSGKASKAGSGGDLRPRLSFASVEFPDGTVTEVQGTVSAKKKGADGKPLRNVNFTQVAEIIAPKVGFTAADNRKILSANLTTAAISNGLKTSPEGITFDFVIEGSQNATVKSVKVRAIPQA